jgi:site-specific DNA-cytosine methylase
MIYLKARKRCLGSITVDITRRAFINWLPKLRFSKADVVVGGFPCQSFSHSGKRRGFEDDKGHDLKEAVNANGENSRGSLYKSFVEVVRRVKPKMFVAENVYGLMTTRRLSRYAGFFGSVGYQVVYCPEFGIPQTRRRCYNMGISKSRDKNADIVDGWNFITNKIECFVGKYFEHLKEPARPTIFRRWCIQRRRDLKRGRVKPRWIWAVLLYDEGWASW